MLLVLPLLCLLSLARPDSSSQLMEGSHKTDSSSQMVKGSHKPGQSQEAEMEELRMEMADLKLELMTLLEEKEVSLRSELQESVRQVHAGLSTAVRDLPYILVCAFKQQWSAAGSVITYDRFISDFNNANRPGGGDGVLDLEAGTFTCLRAGHYTVSYSGNARMQPGGEVTVIIIIIIIIIIITIIITMIIILITIIIIIILIIPYYLHLVHVKALDYLVKLGVELVKEVDDL